MMASVVLRCVVETPVFLERDHSYFIRPVAGKNFFRNMPDEPLRPSASHQSLLLSI